NKQPEFLSKETIEQLNSGADIVISQESKEAYDDNSYLTSKRVALKHIKSCSNSLKEKNSTLNITHVLDREFDDSEYFDFIQDLKDEFVIRLKKNRTVAGLSGDKEQKGKLIDHAFEHSYIFCIQKLYISGRCFQDCVIKAKWQKIGQYHVVLMTLLDRKGKVCIRMIVNGHSHYREQIFSRRGD
ncbi:hypothetical protein, partial [Cysteiniphilum litorale]|uniref:hypothetical protein n=1 Tax=Cysteiniphilum litorale TaxID=2056700 RepID=UPI003F881656